MGDSRTDLNRPDGGWAGTAMRWLGYVTAMVEVSIAWLLATLAGGVMLGWLPASVAAGTTLHTLLEDEPTSRPLGDTFRAWRAAFRRANAVGWPATAGTILLAINTAVMSQGEGPLFIVVRVATIVIGLWWILAVGYIVTLLGTPATRGLPAASMWRNAILLPVGSPGTSLAWFVTVASLAVICWVVPVVGVLAGPGLVWFVTFWLNRRRFAEIDQDARDDDSRTITSNGA